MKIEGIHITNINGITDIKLDFNPSVNILCGPNGIGKTTILESITHSFVYAGTEVLKRNAKAENGEWQIKYNNQCNEISIEISTANFSPQDVEKVRGRYQDARNIISIKSIRNFGYTLVDSIKKDPGRSDFDCANIIDSGVQFSDAKNWLIHRILFSNVKDALSNIRHANLQSTLSCFSILNKEFKFSRIKAETFDVLIDTPEGEIYFEYLSSGFKSILYILFSIIKEIELRFIGENEIRVSDFDGIIAIDEIELHLHPEWQTKIVDALTAVFPKAQFFLSTHSPHVIQAAAPEQIIALEHIDGGVAKRELPNSKYGYRGWTVEEILTDVMGMADTRTEEYSEQIKAFEKALDEENALEARKAYDKISEMLHPANVTRKLLEIQMAGLVEEGDHND